MSPESMAIRSRPAQSRHARMPTGTLVAACFAVSAVSLFLPFAPAYDPWAWLVWGREVIGLDLDTTGGPSWKPLPVVFTTVFSVFEPAAPALWLLTARVGGLLALSFTYRLASRFGGRAAGAVSVGALVLTPDGASRFVRHLAEGHSAPIEAALALWAVERHLDGRRAHALLLGAGVALLRPEAWPFVALYGAWIARAYPGDRRLVALALLLVPVLWFGGDLWGSGNPWHGADVAQVASGDGWARLGLALERGAKLVAPPFWVAAIAALAMSRRRGERAPVVLAGGAAAWFGLVAVTAVLFRYAALSRFLAPVAAVVCVLAGVGAVRLVGAARSLRRPVRVALAVVVAAVSAPSLVGRVVGIGTQTAESLSQARYSRDLDVVIDRAGGADVVLACGAVSIDQSRLVASRPALAWRLEVPLDRIRHGLEPVPGVVFAVAGGVLDGELSARPASEVALLGRSAEWAVHARDCP